MNALIRRSLLTLVPATAALTAMALETEAQGPAQPKSTATPVPAAKASAPPRKDAAVSKVQGDAVPPKPKVDPEAEKKMEDLLVRWSDQSKTVKALSVKYKRVDESVAFNIRKEYTGQAQLKSPDWVYLDFFEIVEGKSKEYADERIVCDQKNVYQFVGQTKNIWVYPLQNDPNQKALNQGPLPFLFNMTVARAKERYIMRYLGETDTAYMIQIIPKLPLDREEFTQAWVKLDKTRFLPTAIRLWEVNGQDTKTFTFDPKTMVQNAEINAAWFDGPTMITKLTRDPKLGWKVTYNPKPDQDPRAPQGAPAGREAGPVGARPAAKGSGVKQQR